MLENETTVDVCVQMCVSVCLYGHSRTKTFMFPFRLYCRKKNIFSWLLSQTSREPTILFSVISYFVPINIFTRTFFYIKILRFIFHGKKLMNAYKRNK